MSLIGLVEFGKMMLHGRFSHGAINFLDLLPHTGFQLVNLV